MLQEHIFEHPELNEAQLDSAKILGYCVYQLANSLATLLYGQLRLPPFYFTQAAGQIGIPSNIFKYWKGSTWPLNPNQDQKRLRIILAIFLRVYERLLPYCPDTTYQEAQETFRQRIQELKDLGITHNKLTQHLRISNRTLTDIMKPPPSTNHRPRHCPWEMLDKLYRADTEINTASQARSAPRRSPKDFMDIHDELKGIPTDQFTPCITINGNCAKCNASWAHLYYDGLDALANVIYTCRTCGQSNIVKPINQSLFKISPQPNGNKKYTERYGPCNFCNAPWHNLTREGLDQFGNTVHTCSICSNRNYVKPKQSILIT